VQLSSLWNPGPGSSLKVQPSGDAWMSRNAALVLVLALGSLIVPTQAWAQLTPPAGSAPPIPGQRLIPAASGMRHWSRRSEAIPRRHRCPTDRSIRIHHRARASSRRLMRVPHSGFSARMASIQEARSAGEVAHRSARSREFAGGARARLTFSFLCVACSDPS
jgi:hypothetical protein